MSSALDKLKAKALKKKGGAVQQAAEPNSVVESESKVASIGDAKPEGDKVSEPTVSQADQTAVQMQQRMKNSRQDDRFFRMRLEEIHTDEQVREEFDQEELEHLASVIHKKGFDSPIKVFFLNGKCFLKDGERRFRALNLLAERHPDEEEWQTVPCFEVDGRNFEDDKAQYYIDQLNYNHTAKHLKPIEFAKACKRIMELDGNLSQRKLAKQLGYSNAMISNHLALLGLPEDVQERVEKGELGAREALKYKDPVAEDNEQESSGEPIEDFPNNTTPSNSEKTKSDDKPKVRAKRLSIKKDTLQMLLGVLHEKLSIDLGELDLEKDKELIAFFDEELVEHVTSALDK